MAAERATADVRDAGDRPAATRGAGPPAEVAEPASLDPVLTALGRPGSSVDPGNPAPAAPSSERSARGGPAKSGQAPAYAGRQITSLQRLAGNRAVSSLLRRSDASPARPGAPKEAPTNGGGIDLDAVPVAPSAAPTGNGPTKGGVDLDAVPVTPSAGPTGKGPAKGGVDLGAVPVAPQIELKGGSGARDGGKIDLGAIPVAPSVGGGRSGPAQGGTGPGVAPPTATHPGAPARKAERPAPKGPVAPTGPASGGLVKATPAPLTEVAPASAGAQIVVEEVKAAAEDGQVGLAAAVDQGVGQIQAATLAQQVALDETATSEHASIESAFGQAGARVQSAVAAASQQLAAAAATEHGRLQAAHSQSQAGASQIFTAKQAAVVALGETRGTEAVDAAQAAGARVQGQARTLQDEARQSGESKAATAHSDSPDGAKGMQQAARQVAANTAEEIGKSLGDTVAQLRQLGAEAKPGFTQQAGQVASQLMAALPSIIDALGKTQTEASTALAQATTGGTTALSQLGAGVMSTLTALQSDLRQSLDQGVATSKQALVTSGDKAIGAVQQEHDAATQAGAAVINHVLSSVGNRRIRRAAAKKLADQMGSQLRSSFGSAEQQAQMATAQIAQVFAVAAQDALGAVRTAGAQGREHAAKADEDASQQAGQHAGRVAGQMAATASAALGAHQHVVTAAGSSLESSVSDLDARFQRAVGDLRGRLEGKVGEAVDRARAPLGDLGGRIDTAMRKADEKAHQSWLDRQLGDIVENINWGMLAGLVVGLLVTIAFIALFGSGLGVLILAGALAGALSTMASTLVQNAVEGKPTDWKDLGKQMAMGAVFGALGGALGGGLAGGLEAQVASGAMRQATAALAGKAGNVVVGVVVGVVQNVATGQPWDKGLLFNIGQGALMTVVAGPAIEKVTQGARGAAIDANIASEASITPQERAAANTRASTAGEPLPFPGPSGERAGPAPAGATETGAAGPGTTAAGTETAPPAGAAPAPPVELVESTPVPRTEEPPRPAPGAPATPEQVETHFGIPEENQKKFQQICDEHDVVVEVRPTNLDSLELLKSGEGVPKPEDVKAKTITPEDVHLGCRPEDKGKVGFFEPKETVEQLTQRLQGEGLTPQEIEKVKARYEQRKTEFEHLKEKMAELQKETGSQDADAHHISGENQIFIDENGVVHKVGADGSLKPIVGDHDVFSIRKANGEPLTRAEYEVIVAKMKAGGMGVAHGAHVEWSPPDAKSGKIFEKIFTGHTSGSEPVVRFGPGGDVSPTYPGNEPAGTGAIRGGIVGGVNTEGPDRDRKADEEDHQGG